MDQKPYCRTCILETNELIGVHGEIGRSYCMEDIIKQHFGILINSTDKISTKVCTVCWNKVDSFHGFYNQVLAAQTLLNDNNLSILEEDNKEDVRSLIGYENSVNILDGKLKRECNKEESVADLSGTTEDALQKITSLDEEVKSEQDNEYKIDDESSSSSEESWDSETKEKRTTRKGPIKQGSKRKVNANTEGSTAEKNKPVGTSNTTVKSTESKIKKRPVYHLFDGALPAKKEMINLELINSFYNMQCGLCNEVCKDFQSLMNHYRRQHDTRGYIFCCNKQYFKRIELADHVMWHRNPENFKCKICSKDKVFNSSKSLYYHMRLHDPADTKFKCDECGRDFPEQGRLNFHKLKHLPPEQRKFKCELCKKSYISIGMLNHHRKFAHNKTRAHMCEICAKQFRSSSEYQAHKRHLHEGVVDPRVTCDICGKSLKNRGTLRHHLATHKDSKTVFQCDICDRITNSLNALRSHRKFVHFSEKNFKCSVCSKAFKRKISLMEHMTTHTGERLYNCSFCTKTFNSNANMWSHRKKMHPAEWEAEQMLKALNN